MLIIETVSWLALLALCINFFLEEHERGSEFVEYCTPRTKIRNMIARFDWSMTIARGHNSQKIRVLFSLRAGSISLYYSVELRIKIACRSSWSNNKLFLTQSLSIPLQSSSPSLPLHCILKSFILAFLYDDTPNWLLNEEFENTVIEDLGVFIEDIGSEIDR